MNLIKGSAKFIVKNIVPILSIVLILFLITSYMAMHGVVFHKSKPILKRVVVIEGLNGATTENNYADTGQQILIAKGVGAAHQTLTDKATIEADTEELLLPEKFCSIHLTDLEAGDKACRELLTSDTCNLTNCCIWASHKMDGQLCVAGDYLGATFDSHNYESQFSFQGAGYP